MDKIIRENPLSIRENPLLQYSRFIYALPIIIGIGVGLIITQQPKGAESSELSPAVESPPQAAQTGGQAEPSSSGTIEQHIVTAQSLLTRAIELSRETQKDAEDGIAESAETERREHRDRAQRTQREIQENNTKIIKLVNQAIDATNQAVSLNPNDPRGYAQRAKIYQTISGYMPEAEEQAIANYKMAVKLNPGNKDYCVDLADLLLTRNNTEKDSTLNNTENIKSAVFYLQLAVDNNPTDPNLLKKSAEVKTQAGYIQEARNDYQQLIGLLSEKDQKDKIKAEIDSLNNLLAETASGEGSLDSARDDSGEARDDSGEARDDSGEARDDNKEIVLPDEPPKLQASHLAEINTVIASPDDSEKLKMQNAKLDSNSLSGTGIIPAGEKEIEICNNNLSPDSQVYLSPETKINQILFVKRKAPYNPETDRCPHFVAATANPVPQDLEFRFLIIEE